MPGNLDVAGGRLTITAGNGIAYKSQSTGGTGAFNQQENALGVGVSGTKKTRLETTLAAPFLADGTTANSEQAGLWFGPDQDNYVKLVVSNASIGGALHHRVQLLREQSGASAGADEINVPSGTTAPNPVPNFSSTTVRLILELDPALKKAEAWYQVGSGEVQRVGELDARRGEVLRREPAASRGALGRHRQLRRHLRLQAQPHGTAPVTFSFEDFSMAEENAANRAPVFTPVADRTTDEDSAVDLAVAPPIPTATSSSTRPPACRRA